MAAPTVILWPDEERLWTQCIDQLRASYPLLWSLGEYSQEKAIGPAAWLRYQLETQSGGDVPVIYLPGIGRSAFRSAEQCPDRLKHLFALQYQGQFWTQKNGRDWTPFAFLSGSGGGLKLDVAADQETKKAIHECLKALLEVDVDELRGKKLEAGDFRAIVAKDPERMLLRWMDDPGKVKAAMDEIRIRVGQLLRSLPGYLSTRPRERWCDYRSRKADQWQGCMGRWSGRVTKMLRAPIQA